MNGGPAVWVPEAATGAQQATPKAAPAPRRPFQRFSLAQQFLLACTLVLLAGALAVGSWVGEQLEQRIVHRTARMASLYFESIVVERVRALVTRGELGAESRAQLDRIFVDGPLAQKVVRFKLWTVDGHIHYSSLASQVGRDYALHEHHAQAFAGAMVAGISDLDGPDNADERARWSRLIEIYVPLRMPGSDTVAAVAEFYHSMDGVDADIRSAKAQSWGVIALGTLLLASGLFTLVQRASRTISGQRSDLQHQLEHLLRLLAENRAMHARLLRSGAQTTAMTELSLRRVAADIHDGPIQDLAFTLLTLSEGPSASRQRESLQRAMQSLRGIAGGLVVPGMQQLSLPEVVRRAAADAQGKCGVAVEVCGQGDPGAVPEALKITAYRVVQEALSNSLRHATGHVPRVTLRCEDRCVLIEVADDGPGFDLALPAEAGHLGLAFLRERVQLLGGTLTLQTAPGRGTRVEVQLPLPEPGACDD